MNKATNKYVVKDTSRRDTVIGVLVGALVLGFVIYAVMHLSEQVTGNWRTGRIRAKTFTPKPETDITIGKSGVSSQNVAGEYTFDVYVDDEKRSYHVFVAKPDYDGHNVGDSFRFLLPPSEWKR